jgi:hypothetical protein
MAVVASESKNYLYEMKMTSEEPGFKIHSRSPVIIV